MYLSFQPPSPLPLGFLPIPPLLTPSHLHPHLRSYWESPGHIPFFFFFTKGGNGVLVKQKEKNNNRGNGRWRRNLLEMKCSEWSKRAPCPGGTHRPVAPSSTGSWLLPVANVDCSVLRTQTLPSLALRAYIYIFLSSSNMCAFAGQLHFLFSLPDT